MQNRSIRNRAVNNSLINLVVLHPVLERLFVHHPLFEKARHQRLRRSYTRLDIHMVQDRNIDPSNRETVQPSLQRENDVFVVLSFPYRKPKTLSRFSG